MKRYALLILGLKIADLSVQLIIGLTVLLLLRANGPAALLLLAAIQYLSTLLWAIPARGVPVLTARRPLQVVFIALGSSILLLIAAAASLPDRLLPGLFVAGSVLSLWYLIVTAAEVSFYRKRLEWKTFR